MEYRTGPILDPGTEVGREWFKNLPVNYDPDFVTFFDDFNRTVFNATDDWTVIKDSGAAVGITADTLNGVVGITSAATTDNDGGSIQANEVFQAASGREIWFEAKVKLHDADDQDFFVGLCENFATDPEACLTSSNRIGFQVTEGNASILCKTEASDVESSTDSQKDAADATYVTLGFVVRNTTHVDFYVNRVLVAMHTSSIPTSLLTPALMSVSGSATGTFITYADYIAIWTNR